MRTGGIDGLDVIDFIDAIVFIDAKDFIDYDASRNLKMTVD